MCRMVSAAQDMLGAGLAFFRLIKYVSCRLISRLISVENATFPSSVRQLSPSFYQDDQIFIFPALLRRLGIGLLGCAMFLGRGCRGGTGDAVFGAEDVTFPHCLLVFHGHVSVTTCDWAIQVPGSGGIPWDDTAMPTRVSKHKCAHHAC
jgi:hypothetical protein